VKAGYVGYIYLENQEKALILRDKITFNQTEDYEVFDVSKNQTVSEIDVKLMPGESLLCLIISKS
jgi:hypothetical protein